jgi:hypothetical protein
MKRQGGTIQQWWIDETTFAPDKVVRGVVEGDDYWGRTPLRTSTIVSINENETELETLNTIYKLGEKRLDVN